MFLVPLRSLPHIYTIYLGQTIRARNACVADILFDLGLDQHTKDIQDCSRKSLRP